ncbi:ABC transporter permease [Pirellulimonas nuda]|nr:ABC transporter permease subunit [Pirellulimonas nuda]
MNRAGVILALACLVGLLASGLAPRSAGLMQSSLALAAAVCVLAMPLGVALAVLVWKTDAPGARWGAALLIAQLFLPIQLHAAGWMAAFGFDGWWTLAHASDQPADPLLAGFWGAVWVHAMAAVPWIAVITGAGLRAVDAQLEEAALPVMSGPQVLMRVSLRMAAPAAAAALLWTCVVVGGEMTVTDLFQVRTFAEEVYTQSVLGAFDPAAGDDPASRALYAQSPNLTGLLLGLALLTLLAAAALLIGGVLMTRSDDETRPPWRLRLGPLRWVAGAAAASLLAVQIGAPTANLVYQAGVSSYRVEDAASPEKVAWRRSWSAGKAAEMVAAAPWRMRRELGRSLTLGAATATAAAVLGAVLAYALRSAAWRGAAGAAIALGLAAPGVLIGIALVRVFNQPWDSPLWPLTWLYDHTSIAPWLAHVIKATPIAALVLWPAFGSAPSAVLEAAELDGASPWRRLFRVLLPMRPAALAAAWLAALAVSLTELPATILLPGAQTLTVRLFNLLHYGVEDQAAGVCLFQMLLFGGLAAVTMRFWNSRGTMGNPKDEIRNPKQA